MYWRLHFYSGFALFFVTWFVYKAFGLHGAHMYDVVMLQAVVSVSVDMLPLPGGMGISENLFLIIFKGVFTAGLLAAGNGTQAEGIATIFSCCSSRHGLTI